MSNVKSIKIIAAYNPYARIPGTPRDNAYLEVARAVGSWALVPSFGLTATVYELPPPPKGFPVGLTIEGEEAVVENRPPDLFDEGTTHGGAASRPPRPGERLAAARGE